MNYSLPEDVASAPKHVGVLSKFAKFEKRLLASSCLPFLSSAKSNSAPTVRILVRFDMSTFREKKTVEKMRVS
jgi:hypothetical protein